LKEYLEEIKISTFIYYVRNHHCIQEETNELFLQFEEKVLQECFLKDESIVGENDILLFDSYKAKEYIDKIRWDDVAKILDNSYRSMQKESQIEEKDFLEEKQKEQEEAERRTLEKE
jgi:hypothetical protein